MEEYVWISKVTHDHLFDGHSHSILLRLAEYYNVKISIAAPDSTDPRSYVKAVYDAIQRKIAGLMIVGWQDADVIAAVDAAVKNGIPVVCVDKDLPRSKRHAYVGADWHRLGATMADNLAALMNNQGKALVLGAFDPDNINLGIRGFH